MVASRPAKEFNVTGPAGLACRLLNWFGAHRKIARPVAPGGSPGKAPLRRGGKRSPWEDPGRLWPYPAATTESGSLSVRQPKASLACPTASPALAALKDGRLCPPLRAL